MSRKVLIAFLGSNRYKECVYTFAGEQSPVVRFVQEAIIRLQCTDWSEGDKIFLFLTEDAEQQNWLGRAYTGETEAGLLHCLEKLSNAGLRPEICPVTQLPPGFSEDEVWTIFDTVFNVLRDEDEVYLDITHAFRSLPMLAMTLINYAKTLKNIRLQKIYYGAFEKLGPGYKIEDNYPDPATRIVPILDLSSFSELQDWSMAAKSFIRAGDPEHLSELMISDVIPIIRDSPDKRATAILQKKLSERLDEVALMLSTNRGNELIGAQSFEYILNNIAGIARDETVIEPLKPLLGVVVEKIQAFTRDKELNWLDGVRWCLQHNLIQQGITQLQEGVITYLCSQHNDLSSNDEEDRKLVKTSLYYTASPRESQLTWKWSFPLKNVLLIKEVLAMPEVPRVAREFQALSNLRNDINHGGYLGHARPANRFAAELRKAYDNISQTILESLTS